MGLHTLVLIRLSSIEFSFWFSTLDKECINSTIVSCEVSGIQDGSRNLLQVKLSPVFSAKPAAKSLPAQPVACCRSRGPQLAICTKNLLNNQEIFYLSTPLFYLHHPPQTSFASSWPWAFFLTLLPKNKVSPNQTCLSTSFCY